MRALTLAPLLVVLASPPAAGQPAVPYTRADLQATVGWNNIRHPVDRTGVCCYSSDWMNAIGIAEATSGWFWTEHLRTTFDVAANSTGHQYEDASIFYNGQQVYQPATVEVHQWQIAMGQQYQFGHNAWFHPHVGGGVLVAFQQEQRYRQPFTYYDQAARTTRTIGDASRTKTNETLVRPFADVGFKAYVSRKVYFVHDTRFVAGPHGLDQLAFKFGFGVDFW